MTDKYANYDKNPTMGIRHVELATPQSSSLIYVFDPSNCVFVETTGTVEIMFCDDDGWVVLPVIAGVQYNWRCVAIGANSNCGDVYFGYSGGADVASSVEVEP